MKSKVYSRALVSQVYQQLTTTKELIQIIIGARQVGKTTAAHQIAELWEGPVFYASADNPLPPGPEWVRYQWERTRTNSGSPSLLILDEIQKVNGWSEIIKKLADEERLQSSSTAVLLLGSSALLLQRGLTESLSGRFYLHRMPHWSASEIKAAFSLDLNEWLYFGGYPGAIAYRSDEEFWKNYVSDSLIETVLSKDVLQVQTINKPALLRHLFFLSVRYPAQILSYNKMLGQLTDAGNTTTLAHYLKLLASSFLLSGLENFRPGGNQKKGSSPKLVLWNNALINALSTLTFLQARQNPEYWGRLVENAVGAALLNQLQGYPYEIYYWRKGNDEVDFIVIAMDKIWAVEVKSSRLKSAKGLKAFLKLCPKARPIIIGGNGMPLGEFFNSNIKELFS